MEWRKTGAREPLVDPSCFLFSSGLYLTAVCGELLIAAVLPPLDKNYGAWDALLGWWLLAAARKCRRLMQPKTASIIDWMIANTVAALGCRRVNAETAFPSAIHQKVRVVKCPCCPTTIAAAAPS